MPSPLEKDLLEFKEKIDNSTVWLERSLDRIPKLIDIILAATKKFDDLWVDRNKWESFSESVGSLGVNLIEQAEYIREPTNFLSRAKEAIKLLEKVPMSRDEAKIFFDIKERVALQKKVVDLDILTESLKRRAEEIYNEAKSIVEDRLLETTVSLDLILERLGEDYSTEAVDDLAETGLRLVDFSTRMGELGEEAWRLWDFISDYIDRLSHSTRNKDYVEKLLDAGQTIFYGS